MKPVISMPSNAATPLERPQVPVHPLPHKITEAEEIEFEHKTKKFTGYINIKRRWVYIFLTAYLLSKVIVVTCMLLNEKAKFEKRVAEELKRLKQIEYAKSK